MSAVPRRSHINNRTGACIGIYPDQLGVTNADCGYTRHVKAAMLQFYHVLAFAALLPLAPLRNVHEQLHVRICGTEAFVFRALAANTSLLVAESTGANLGLDLNGSNEFGAVGVRAVGWVGRRKLFDFEIERLHEFLGE